MNTERGNMLSTTEAAARLGCSDDTVSRLIHSRELPAYRVGRRWKISETDLAAYLERQRTISPDADTK